VTDVLAIDVAGERLLLDAARAVYWPARQVMLIADAHFGKAQVFREHGIALPEAGTAADLARLDALIARHRPQQLVVLGDLVHGRTALDADWIAALVRWRARHPSLHCSVVRGNHDRHLDAGSLGFTSMVGSELHPPFVFAHEPHADPRGYVLAGHIHPGIVLRERHAPKARLPVFWFRDGTGVLPAFGRLTGLWPIAPAPGERMIAVAGSSLVGIPAMRQR
jgi:DNA ligase-associated metallophosphoesterase